MDEQKRIYDEEEERAIWGDVENIPYFSKRFIMQRFLDLPDDEIQTSERHLSEQPKQEWAEVKAALLDGLPESKRSAIDSLLDNQKQSVMEQTRSDELSEFFHDTQVEFNARVLLPIIRQVLPPLMSEELCGVQPMTGPCAQIFSLRYTYGERNTELEDLMADTATAEEYLADLKSRPLHAQWSVESMTDLTTEHGMDMEQELFAAFSKDLQREIDAEVLADLAADETIDVSTVNIIDRNDDTILIGYKRHEAPERNVWYCPYVPTDGKFITQEDLAYDYAKEVITKHGVINCGTS